MSTFTAVDLSRLPAPAIVEVLDFEVILSAMLADLRELDPQFDALTESEPAHKLLQVAAYREMNLRQRVNESIRAVMLAYAIGADLDQLAANFNVARLMLDAGDPAALPPVLPTWEPDDDLRRRVQLAFEGLSTAGPAGAYIFHALGADADVADCAAISPSPGIVEIYVLARSGTGTPSPGVLAAVEAKLSADDVRPLTDHVTVHPVGVVNYTVEAELEVFNGPDSAVVKTAAQAAAEDYVLEQRKIGRPSTRSGLFAALHQPGVRNVNLIQPAEDVEVTDTQVAVCTGVSVEIA